MVSAILANHIIGGTWEILPMSATVEKFMFQNSSIRTRKLSVLPVLQKRDHLK